VIEDQETRYLRLKNRIDGELRVLAEVSKSMELTVVTTQHSDGLMGDPGSTEYHSGLGRGRQYTLVDNVRQDKIKVLGWNKRTPGTETELEQHFLSQLDGYRVKKLIWSYDSALVAKHQVLINKFLEIAERKVAVIDDYGDENWDSLSEEITRCALKIAKLEGDRGGQRVRGVWNWFTYKIRSATNEEILWQKYDNLCKHLENEFRIYHRNCKSKPKPEAFNELSGIDFEVYLAEFLKNFGFENIAGTPTVGDQGADLLATKNGRRIAIQAKRYKGCVGNDAVQEIVGALKFYKADEGWVITTGTFTTSARTLAQVNGVRLIDGTDLQTFQG
jgi:hypothetical protein